MIQINRDALQEGMLVTGRNNTSAFGKLIRAGVHSFTNHNAMVVKKDGEWFIAEAKPPVSVLTPIEDYEKIMNEDGYLVRFYTLKSFTPEQSAKAARFFVEVMIGIPYPKKIKMFVLALPIYNAFVDKTGLLPPIRTNWCSQLCKHAYLSVNPDCLDGVNGKKKEMFSPKTFENRIMFGLFDDKTDDIVIEKGIDNVND